MPRDEEAPVFGARGVTERLIPRAGFILAGNHPEGDPRTGWSRRCACSRSPRISATTWPASVSATSSAGSRRLFRSWPRRASARRRSVSRPTSCRSGTRRRSGWPRTSAPSTPSRAGGSTSGSARRHRTATCSATSGAAMPRPIRTRSSSGSSRRSRADRSRTIRCTRRTVRRFRGSSRISPGCAIASGSAAARSGRFAGPRGTGSSCCSAT